MIAAVMNECKQSNDFINKRTTFINATFKNKLLVVEKLWIDHWWNDCVVCVRGVPFRKFQVRSQKRTHYERPQMLSCSRRTKLVRTCWAPSPLIMMVTQIKVPV